MSSTDYFSDILGNIKPQGEFCTRLNIPLGDLHIGTKGGDTLKFPLTAKQVKALIKQAKPAQFGWKEKTLQDTKVRDTWEISKSKINIDKRQWNKSFNPLLDSIKVNLGLAENAKLSAQLHNLLIYESGQFFQPHQDSEKAEGMVATLVIILPSAHKGGALYIDHAGEKKSIQTSRAALDKLTCVAFYADCHHEVKPLTEGYRVALTYNLVLKNAEDAYLSVNADAEVNTLVSALDQYFTDCDAEAIERKQKYPNSGLTPKPPKWVYLLDHQYTQKSLNRSHLKNGDRIRVSSIEQAAATLNLDMFMALAEVQEMWQAESDYEEYGYRSRRGRRYFCDDEETEGSDKEEYRLIDLIDCGFELTHWVDQTGKPYTGDKLSISNHEVCWTKANDTFDPFYAEYEGYMGNYGNTLDRWYHRAAVILYRKNDRYAMMCDTNPDLLVKELIALAKKTATREEAQNRVTSILPYWHLAQRSVYADLDNKWIKSVFTLASLMESPSLAKSLVEPLGLASLNTKTAQVFVDCQLARDVSWCIDVLQAWIDKDGGRYNTKQINDFEPLIKQLHQKLAVPVPILDWLFDYQYRALKHTHARRVEQDTPVQLKKDQPRRVEDFRELLAACVINDKQILHQKVVKYLKSNALLYVPLALADILYPLDKHELHDVTWGYQVLFNYIYDELTHELQTPLRKKSDWSITDNVSCQCADCQVLSEYLKSSEMKEKVWPLASARRQHIHRMIDGMGVPVTHVTQKQGSPYKLVLKKTDGLYNQAVKQRLAVEACAEKFKQRRVAS